MLPQAFTKLMDVCNRSILDLESCIAAADSCEDLCQKPDLCALSAKDFVEQAQSCITTSHSCIKVLDEMIVQFKKEGHELHMEVLNNLVKTLGECIRTLNDSINSCTVLQGCRAACQEARDVCERSLIAIDACVESCEKHELFYQEV
jgi:hypothetical protein